MSIYGNEFGTPAGETIFGSYGEFEAVPADYDWDAHNAEADAEAEQEHWEEDPAYGALYFPTDVDMGMYDDDPNPYHGDYFEDDGY